MASPISTNSSLTSIEGTEGSGPPSIEILTQNLKNAENEIVEAQANGRPSRSQLMPLKAKVSLAQELLDKAKRDQPAEAMIPATIGGFHAQKTNTSIDARQIPAAGTILAASQALDARRKIARAELDKRRLQDDQDKMVYNKLDEEGKREWEQKEHARKKQLMAKTAAPCGFPKMPWLVARLMPGLTPLAVGGVGFVDLDSDDPIDNLHVDVQAHKEKRAESRDGEKMEVDSEGKPDDSTAVHSEGEKQKEDGKMLKDGEHMVVDSEEDTEMSKGDEDMEIHSDKEDGYKDKAVDETGRPNLGSPIRLQTPQGHFSFNVPPAVVITHNATKEEEGLIPLDPSFAPPVVPEGPVKETRGKHRSDSAAPASSSRKKSATQVKKEKALSKIKRKGKGKGKAKTDSSEGEQFDQVDNAAADSDESEAPKGRRTRGTGTASRKKNGDYFRQWKEANEDGRQELRVEAASAITAALVLQQKNFTLSSNMMATPDVRGYMRAIQKFCPESSYTTFEIFKEVHRTSFNNFICGYHQAHSGSNQKLQDGDAKALWKIMGQPMPYDVGQGGAANYVAAVPGHFHCGCNENEVAVGYYIWKTWSITRVVEGVAAKNQHGAYTGEFTGETVTEGLDTLHLTPRIRAFLCDHLATIGVTVDTIYRWGRSTDEARGFLLQTRMNADVVELNAISLRTGMIEPGQEFYIGGGPPNKEIEDA
ncbi:hypothetical protein C8J57DRAFT_1218188 [Mycena rebaudengoi]|nr:hypothetical protein C8J57DRAFT_1218188 [Mycena rebaudengoi]